MIYDTLYFSINVLFFIYKCCILLRDKYLKPQLFMIMVIVNPYNDIVQSKNGSFATLPVPRTIPHGSAPSVLGWLIVPVVAY